MSKSTLIAGADACDPQVKATDKCQQIRAGRTKLWINATVYTLSSDLIHLQRLKQTIYK